MCIAALCVLPLCVYCRFVCIAALCVLQEVHASHPGNISCADHWLLLARSRKLYVTGSNILFVMQMSRKMLVENGLSLIKLGKPFKCNVERGG